MCPALFYVIKEQAASRKTGGGKKEKRKEAAIYKNMDATKALKIKGKRSWTCV